MRVTRKIFTRATTNLIFLKIDYPEIFSFLLYFLLLFMILIFFVCLFFTKLKIYIPIYIRLCGWVSDKNFFTRPVSGKKTPFFWASLSNFRLKYLVYGQVFWVKVGRLQDQCRSIWMLVFH